MRICDPTREAGIEQASNVDSGGGIESYWRMHSVQQEGPKRGLSLPAKHPIRLAAKSVSHTSSVHRHYLRCCRRKQLPQEFPTLRPMANHATGGKRVPRRRSGY